MTGVCKGCGGPLPASRGGRPRKWCSDRCRKSQYAQPCVDCGGPTKDGSGGRVAEPRCVPCGNKLSGEKRSMTDEYLIGCLRDFAERYGRPPCRVDFDPFHARHIRHDEDRARAAERDGRQNATTFVRHFGSWNAAMRAAGFEPRPAHGTSEVARGRHLVERAR